MLKYLWVFLLLCIPTITQAVDPPRTLVRCKVTEVHDADTFWCDVLLPWDVAILHQKIRVQGADAWEIDRSRKTVKITTEELAKGKVAKAAVVELFSKADGVYLEPPRKGDIIDPHSRMSAYVWVFYKDKGLIALDQWLKDNGYVRVE